MLSAVRQAIATQIEAGMAGTLHVTPYVLSNPNPPCAEIYPGPIDYDLAMARGMDEWTFRLRVYVGEVSDIGSQTTLDQYLEPNSGMSIKKAVESDRLLGGLVYDISATGCTGYQRYQVEGRGIVLGAEWTIVLMVDGNAP